MLVRSIYVFIKLLQTLSPHFSVFKFLSSPRLLSSFPSLLTSVSGCLKRQLTEVVHHHYRCFHMNAQSHMNISFPTSRCFDNVSLTHCTTRCLFLSHPSYTRRECRCWCVCVCERDAKYRERDRERKEWRKGEERRFWSFIYAE